MFIGSDLPLSLVIDPRFVANRMRERAGTDGTEPIAESWCVYSAFVV
jgi:hypothetical protein